MVQTAGRTIAQLIENAQRMSALVGSISTASVQQSRGVGEVSAAVAQLDQDTQRNAALVEQTSAAAMSMREQA